MRINYDAHYKTVGRTYMFGFLISDLPH